MTGVATTILSESSSTTVTSMGPPEVDEMNAESIRLLCGLLEGMGMLEEVADLAGSLSGIVEMSYAAGEFGRAERLLPVVVNAWRKVVPLGPAHRVRLASDLGVLAVAESLVHEEEEAGELIKEALDTFRGIGGLSAQPDLRWELAGALHRLCDLLARQDQWDAAVPAMAEAVAILEQLVATTNERSLGPTLALAVSLAAELSSLRGDSETELHYCEAAARISKQYLEENAEEGERSFVVSLHNLAMAHTHAGNFAAAMAVACDLEVMASRVWQKSSRSSDRKVLCRIRCTLSDVNAQFGNLLEAKRLALQAVRGFEEEAKGDLQDQIDISAGLGRLANVQNLLGDREGSEITSREVVAILEKALQGAAADATLVRARLALALEVLAYAEFSIDKTKMARVTMMRAIDHFRDLVGTHGKKGLRLSLAHAWANYGSLLGFGAEQILAFENAVGLMKACVEAGHKDVEPVLARTWMRLARAYAGTGQFALAEDELFFAANAMPHESAVFIDGMEIIFSMMVPRAPGIEAGDLLPEEVRRRPRTSFASYNPIMMALGERRSSARALQRKYKETLCVRGKSSSKPWRVSAEVNRGSSSFLPRGWPTTGKGVKPG